MQPNYSSVGQIFSAQTRYTVPLFQRPYVWTEAEQWHPLWDDLSALADRVLDPPSHKPVAGHFLGTVVLEQVPTVAVVLPQRRVIDGQQRLTTLQLLLKAAQHALEVHGSRLDGDARLALTNAAGQVAQLTANPFTTQDEEQYKVWPTNEDRLAFAGVMDTEANVGVGAQATRMAEAYKFFRTKFMDWLKGTDSPRRALALASALKDHLRIIVLDLDDNDEPQAIFETLNAHGTPLLPADLMKNWLLWEAGKQKLNANLLYSSYWRPFDAGHEYWRKIVGTGHAARPRVDTFLQNWLTLRTVEPIPVKHLYDRFLAYAAKLKISSDDEALDTETLMTDIAESAERFREIDNPAGADALHAAFRRLLRLDFVVFRPVLMALLERRESDPQGVLTSVRALESFLVRRMVCNAQTRGYGTLANELLKAIAEIQDGKVAGAIIDALDGEPGSANEWPTDEVFRHNWLTRRFYGWFRRDRVLMLLQAIEEQYQRLVTKAEPIVSFDYSKLTIEHIMPQSWMANWPLSPGVDIQVREDSIQNIGNLTLVSSKLNPSLSNAPWFVSSGEQCKSAGLHKHSTLQLNKRLLDDCGNEWSENSIKHRAAQLFGIASSIWPSGAELRQQLPLTSTLSADESS